MKGDSRLKTVLCVTGIHGFDELEEVDIEAADELARKIEVLVDRLLECFGGSQVSFSKGECVTRFNTARDALYFSSALRNQAAKSIRNSHYRPRTGIHFTTSESSSSGIAYLTAQSLMKHAGPDDVLVTSDVFRETSSLPGLKLIEHGSCKQTHTGTNVSVYFLEAGTSGPGQRKKRTNFRQTRNDEGPLEFGEIRDFIIGLIKTAGRRLPADKIRSKMGHYSRKFDDFMDEMEAEGTLKKETDTDSGTVYYQTTDNYDYDENEHSGSGQHHGRGESAQIDKIISKKEKAGEEFAGHAVSYVIINGIIIFINITAGGSYPFFIYPLLGWGIGFVTHFFSMLNDVREAKELSRLEGISDEELSQVTEYQQNRSSMATHASSNIMVSVLLCGIYALHPVGFVWPAIPVGILGMSIIIHYVSYKLKKNRLLKRLSDFVKGIVRGRKEGGLKRDKTERDCRPQVRRAKSLEQSILSILDTNKTLDESFGGEIRPVLGRYVDQIRFLTEKKAAFERLVGEIPVFDLKKDQILLKKKAMKARSRQLEREYNNSLKEIAL